jgi:LCP family protein required for cell wall assembly
MVLFALALLVSGYYIYHFLSAARDAYEPPKNGATSLDETKPVNILLLGIDERPQDKGRADSIVVLTLNPKNKTLLLTNIPRDTYVTIPGRRYKDKINHSYAFGGVDLARKIVSQFLEIPIDGYVKLNMPGMKTIINELGGIEVNVPFSFSEVGYTFTKGRMKLNGEQALAFSRMRKLDPEGDVGRVKRHQEVIRAMIHKATKMSSILNLDDILQALGNNIKTDIHPLIALKLSRIYANVENKDFQSQTIRGEPLRLQGIFYYQISEEEVNRVQNKIFQFMEKGKIEEGS